MVTGPIMHLKPQRIVAKKVMLPRAGDGVYSSQNHQPLIDAALKTKGFLNALKSGSGKRGTPK